MIEITEETNNFMKFSLLMWNPEMGSHGKWEVLYYTHKKEDADRQLERFKEIHGPRVRLFVDIWTLQHQESKLQFEETMKRLKERFKK